MGLGLYVNGNRCAGWSYSGFNSFREKVAAACGIQLRKMEGFSDVDRSLLLGEDGVYKAGGYEAYRDAILADNATKISWDTIDDPIKHLLHHSDCDGELAPEFCGLVADRLEEIIKDWPKKVTLNPDPLWQERGYPAEMELDDYDTSNAVCLIAGLRQAMSLNVPLEFH